MYCQQVTYTSDKNSVIKVTAIELIVTIVLAT